MPSSSVQKRRRDQIKVMHADLGSWRSVAQLLDLPTSTVHKFATTNWDPKRKSIRVKLGLDGKIDYIRQLRAGDGTFQ